MSARCLAQDDGREGAEVQESFFEEDTPATDADRATTDPALVVDVLDQVSE